MSTSAPRIVTTDVVLAVEEYVESELRDTEKYINRTPLDDTGIWSLHALAAQLYAMGFEDGQRVEAERGRHQVRRLRDAAKKDPAPPVTNGSSDE